jgi:hypothetical protein
MTSSLISPARRRVSASVTSSQIPTIRCGAPASSQITAPCVRIRISAPSARTTRLTSSNG